MSESPSHERHGVAYLLLAVSTFFLAMNHVIARGVHEQIPPLGLSFWRWIVATVFLLPFIRRGFPEILSVYRARWLDFLILGGLMIGGTTLIMVGLNFTTATNVAVINATQPTLTALILWLFVGERLRSTQTLGVMIGFAGALVIVCQGSLSVARNLQFNIGDFITLLAMCGLSTYAIKLARFPRDMTAPQLLFPLILGGSVLLLPFYIVETLFYRPVPVSQLSLTVIPTIALLVSFGSMLLWNTGNQAVGANRASVFINLIPVFGSTMAVLFLGEDFRLYHLVGMILIALGVWLVVGRNATFTRGSKEA